MIAGIQILSFYCCLAFVSVAILGLYPRLDATSSFVALHMKLGKIASHSTMTVAILGLAGLLYKVFRNQRAINSLRPVVLGCFGSMLVLVSAFLAYRNGRAFEQGLAIDSLSKAAHMHHNLACLVLVCLGFFVLGYALECVKEQVRTYLNQHGQPVPTAFLPDEHYFGFERAKKFLFLGINVWWPYLLFRYGLGLSALKALWFLPVHLAGVIPYAILKRKHKFKRTINPAYRGIISNASRYKQGAGNQAPSDRI